MRGGRIAIRSGERTISGMSRMEKRQRTRANSGCVGRKSHQMLMLHMIEWEISRLTRMCEEECHIVFRIGGSKMGREIRENIGTMEK